MSVEETTSCGIAELYNLDTNPAELLLEAEQDSEISSCAFINFSDAIENRNGARLAAYITKHKLGEIIQTPIKVNPSSENKIRQWTWIIDHKKFKTWVKKEEEKEEERWKF